MGVRKLGVDPVVALGVPLLSYVVQLLVLFGGRIFFMFVASPLQETEAANRCAPLKAARAGNIESTVEAQESGIW